MSDPLPTVSTPIPIPEAPADREARTAALLEALEERILVLDGATGTALQGVDLTADDFGGPELEGCNENLCRTRPDVVRGVSSATSRRAPTSSRPTRSARTPLVLAEYGLADQAFELNRLSAALAREACAALRRARAACASSRLDGPDDEGDLGHRRRHLRGAGRATSASRRWA